MVIWGWIGNWWLLILSLLLNRNPHNWLTGVDRRIWLMLRELVNACLLKHWLLRSVGIMTACIAVPVRMEAIHQVRSTERGP